MWVKLDDGFAEHPKILALSDRAFRLHLAALCHCGKHLTDGKIDQKRLKIIAGIVGKPCGKALKELTESGLWRLETDGVFSIHDYAEFNPSAAEVKAKRSSRAEAGRLGGIASGASRRSKSEANASSKRSSTGVEPRPVPSLKEKSLRCFDCAQTFANPQALEQHRYHHHGVEPESYKLADQRAVVA